MKMADDNQKRILIIDDEPGIQQSFANFLEDHSYKVICAEDGKKGLEIVKQEKIDLVLVDLRMPGIDGLEVLSRITKKYPDLPVIIVSGTGVIGDAIEALQKGAWDYLLKPVEDLSILLHAITNALEKAGLRVENKKYQKHLEEIVSRRTKELELKTTGLEKEIDLRKETEQKLKISLHEKGILLKELHHRVKNNMAIISSFLSLKEHSVADKKVKQMFKDCRQRIQVMARVHEKLYGNDSFEYINIKEYFSDIFNDLIKNYYIGPVSISQYFDIDELFFSIDLLIPLGLIINEVLTNSFKYAFNKVDDPLITIELKKTDDKNAVLKIADNGHGFKNDCNDNNSTGINIIKALVNQIGGSVDINSEKGVEYFIEFPT